MNPPASSIVGHTPGPWGRTYSKGPMQPENEWYIFGPDATDNPVLAAVFADNESGLTGATVEANARLIAAAPDLRESVSEQYRLLREWSRTPFFDDPAEWQQWVDDFGARVDAATDRAMNAINKAEGRES